MLIHIDRATGHTAHCSNPDCPVTPHARTVEGARAHRALLLGLTGHPFAKYSRLSTSAVDDVPWEFRPF